MDAFEDMIRHTATPEAPWHVIPADNKWFTHMAVAEAIVKTLEDLNLSYPTVDADTAKDCAAARKQLESKEGQPDASNTASLPLDGPGCILPSARTSYGAAIEAFPF